MISAALHGWSQRTAVASSSNSGAFVSLGTPKVWGNDTATHIKNELMAMLAEALGMDHHFGVARSPWTRGTIERYKTEVIRMARTILGETRRKASAWAQVMPVVQ